jgi:hypothetical protein
MSPADHDDIRAAAALLASAACRWRAGQAAVLGADPDTDRSAAIAAVLARWLAYVLRETGADPREFAKEVIAESIGQEAAEGTPSCPRCSTSTPDIAWTGPDHWHCGACGCEWWAAPRTSAESTGGEST